MFLCSNVLAQLPSVMSHALLTVTDVGAAAQIDLEGNIWQASVLDDLDQKYIGLKKVIFPRGNPWTGAASPSTIV